MVIATSSVEGPAEITNGGQVDSDHHFSSKPVGFTGAFGSMSGVYDSEESISHPSSFPNQNYNSFGAKFCFSNGSFTNVRQVDEFQNYNSCGLPPTF